MLAAFWVGKILAGSWKTVSDLLTKCRKKKLKGILTYLEKRNEKAMFIGRLYFPVFFVYVAQKCFVISLKLFKMFII